MSSLPILAVQDIGKRFSLKTAVDPLASFFEAASQPVDVGFGGHADVMRRCGGRSGRPPSHDRTACESIRRQS